MGMFAGPSGSDVNRGIQPDANPSAGDTVVPDMALGGTLKITMPATGDITIGNPVNGRDGDLLHILLKHGAAGQHVSWDTEYLKNVVLSAAPNATDSLTFKCYPNLWFQVASALNLA